MFTILKALKCEIFSFQFNFTYNPSRYLSSGVQGSSLVLHVIFLHVYPMEENLTTFLWLIAASSRKSGLHIDSLVLSFSYCSFGNKIPLSVEFGDKISFCVDFWWLNFSFCVGNKIPLVIFLMKPLFLVPIKSLLSLLKFLIWCYFWQFNP